MAENYQANMTHNNVHGTARHAPPTQVIWSSNDSDTDPDDKNAPAILYGPNVMRGWDVDEQEWIDI